MAVMVEKTSDLPQTSQGLQDFLRYAQSQLKRNERRNKVLIDLIAECREKLTQHGIIN